MSLCAKGITFWCYYIRLKYLSNCACPFRISYPPTHFCAWLVPDLAAAGLRYKTRIALPVDKARNMLGVVDTTDVLCYGEVFVQYTEMGPAAVAAQQAGLTPKRSIVTGTVLVTKCPCLHPGDVRKFKAVDVPQLHHVVDCIVFPGKGHRPHPDEMAGGSLISFGARWFLSNRTRNLDCSFSKEHNCKWPLFMTNAKRHWYLN